MGVLLAVAICVVAALISIIFAHLMKKDTIAMVNVAFGFGIIFGLISIFVTGGITMNHNHDASIHNKKIATDNIMQKYDVKDVDWDSPQTKAISNLGANGDERSRELVVETKDGKKYIFLYSVKKDSSEPTLDDMAVPSGGTNNESVSAKSLLKK